MSPIQQNLMWVALPYASLVLLVAGMIWRWRTGFQKQGVGYKTPHSVSLIAA